MIGSPLIAPIRPGQRSYQAMNRAMQLARFFALRTLVGADPMRRCRARSMLCSQAATRSARGVERHSAKTCGSIPLVSSAGRSANVAGARLSS